uniref:Uncharacterized protein n=1 Tax=Pinguiococcus pyrenoidosus TaxID=172671 RepID=A0A7R9U7I1_9STRA|mmetsp:Transcript_16163/g.61635  ORF Transcript_16163/g.61635 Transcript_16163/m.61635 type:complete len:107 (+) Transcript_16163:107-427(+)
MAAVDSTAETPTAEAQTSGFWGSWYGTSLSWVGGKALSTVEFIGEVVADVLGLNQSEYQWVIDSIQDDKERQEVQRQIAERRQEQDRQAELAMRQEQEDSSVDNAV